MTTEIATSILAEIHATGSILTPALRDAALGDQHPHGSMLLPDLRGLMEAATAHGRASNWGEVESCIASAYGKLHAAAPEGQTPQGPGYDWHRGTHAIQRAVSAYIA